MPLKSIQSNLELFEEFILYYKYFIIKELMYNQSRKRTKMDNNEPNRGPPPCKKRVINLQPYGAQEEQQFNKQDIKFQADEIKNEQLLDLPDRFESSLRESYSQQEPLFYPPNISQINNESLQKKQAYYQSQPSSLKQPELNLKYQIKSKIKISSGNKQEINKIGLQSGAANLKEKNRQGKESKDKTPIKIGDPPSHNKNNIVVTRGVDFVPVDQYFSRREQARVFQYHKSFYSVTLSQSNLAKDDNKFFIVQLLVIQSNPEEFYLYSRWGRVGVVGQMSENGPLERKNAIRQYNVKTQGKVKTGGYRIVEMSYDHDQQREQANIDQYFLKENSKLPEEVQDLMRLIFDIKMMQTHMKDIGYDEKRSPLGLIARSAIEKGYIALDNILKVLKSEGSEMEKRHALNQYSSQFYSAIPHDFGYLNMKAFVLNSEVKVKQKLEMLASLSQIQIYSNLMNEKVIDDHLPDLDIKYSKLKCEIIPLNKDVPIYPVLLRYLKNTQAKTHDKYIIELVGIFAVRRPQEEEKYTKHIGNKMLLWHGSRLTNFVGILSQGLKIAPYEAPSTGYMFGKGIYFADIASKSANYCLPKHNSSGLMLLCEVALGQMNDKFAADYTAHNLPPGKFSTRGVGKFAPCSGQTIEDVFIPNGELVPTGIEETSLLYNEYAVYNREQIRCRYIVQVNFMLRK